MIVEIPSEYRQIIKINSSFSYLYFECEHGCYLYGKKSETEYFYSTFLPAGTYRIDIKKIEALYPGCKYHAFMYDKRFPFSRFEFSNNNDEEFKSYEFIRGDLWQK